MLHTTQFTGVADNWGVISNWHFIPVEGNRLQYLLRGQVLEALPAYEVGIILLYVLPAARSYRRRLRTHSVRTQGVKR